MNLFFLLLLSLYVKWATAAEASTNASVTVDQVEAVTSCMSMVLHHFYADPAHRQQTPISPCDSKTSVKEAASSGVFRLQGSAAVYRDQLINKTLKIGVPVKTGLNEFMNLENSPTDDHPTVTGFPVDVFNAVMAMLPYQVPYEFILYNGDGDSPGYYDSLISQVYFKEFDAVVGDTSITANRSDFVDFTYEYIKAGISMIVPVEDDDTSSPWWFLKPLTTELWLTTLAFSLLKGILVWIFECQNNSEFQGPPSQVVEKILSFSFSTFEFANTEKLRSNYSRFIVIVWTLLMFILVTSYAANLTSMLTVERLQPTITDVKSLIKNGDYVGYQKGSFVFETLKNLGFDESKLKSYASVEEYADALSKGSGNNGVSAIVDEIPYIRVFLKHHCFKYTKCDWTYRTGGFGFVFPRGSAMLPDISRAVLNFSEGEKMREIERKWFGDQTKCPDSDSPVTNKRLPLYSLRTIYIVAGVTSAIALFIYLIRYLYLAHSSQITPQPETALEFSSIEEDTQHTCSVEINQEDPVNEEGTHSSEEQQSHRPRPPEFSSDYYEIMLRPLPRSFSRTRRNNSARY